ncbi:MAG: BPSS1780 family membrane protein [Piscinibacter sp.]
MRLQSVPAAAGITWVKQGFRIFTRQPLAFSGMFAAFLFLVFVLTLLPLVGSLLLLALLPLGSLGFMIGTRDALQGRVPLPRAFVAPLRQGPDKLRAMLFLGLIYAAASVLIITLAEWADGGALDELMRVLSEGKATPADVAQRLGDTGLFAGLLIRFGLAGVLSVPFWHAPALVHWGTQGVAQSMFSSTIALWRNKAAFLAFALTWFAVVLVLGAAANIVAALLGQPQLIALLAMPASLLLSTVFYASLYFTFADCFLERDDTSPTPATESTP